MQASLWRHRLILLFCLWAGLSTYAQRDTTYQKWSQNHDQIQDYFSRDRHYMVKDLVLYNVHFAEKAYSPQSEEYRTSIYYLAQLYEKEDRSMSAEKTYQKTQQLFIQMGDSLSTDHGILLRQMGHFYQIRGNYKMADSLFHQSLDILREVEGRKNEEYLLTLNYIGNFHAELGEYGEAIKIYEQIGYKFRQPLPTHKQLNLLLDLAYAHEIRGDFEKALDVYQECEHIQEKTTKNLNAGSHMGLLAIALGGQARNHEQLGQFDKAGKKFFQAYSLYQRLRDDDMSTHNKAVLLRDYGAFYIRIGNYKKAEDVYAQISLMAETPQQKAAAKNNLGLLYESMGLYPTAENLYLAAKKIYDVTDQQSLNRRDYANNLSNLAGLYELIGKYKISEEYYLKVKVLDELTIGQEHPDYAATLNNLGKLYISLKKYEEAEQLFKKAEHILYYSVGKYHPNYIKTLSNKSQLLIILQRYDEAEAVLEKVRKTQHKLVGVQHPDYANTLVHLAALYKQMGAVNAAVRHYQKALKIQEDILGLNHPKYAATLNAFGQLQHFLGNRDQALELFKASNSIIIRQLKTIYPILSEQERLRFFGKQEPLLNAFYSFASDYLSELPELALELQNVHLQVKGLALETTITAKHHALKGGDDELKSLFNEWMEVRSKISQIYSMSLREQQGMLFSIDSLLRKSNQLEIELCKKSAYFRNKRAQEQRKINFEIVKKQLSPQEAVIDFMSFRYFNGKNYTEEVRYYALITHQNMSYPQWVRLANEEDLLRFMDRSMSPRSSNYATSQKISYWLYRWIWEPLTPFLNNIKVVHVCPSGLLHKVSFAALMPDSTFLIDHYEIAYYSNLRDFVARNDSSSTNHLTKAFLVGNPNFDTHPGRLKKQANGTQYVVVEKEENVVPVNLFDKGTSGYFYPLEGTEQEVSRISKLLDSAHWQHQFHLQNTAREEAIKNLSYSKKPHILHIATHGYFFPRVLQQDSSSLNLAHLQDKIRYVINPLWRSGLAFAGANYIWRGSSLPSGVEDGVLMAYEVANLNLFGVDLVVLSACDTGRGDLHNSEGVLGLQRAFKAAGAQHLILSLWRIPDEQTSQLMVLFYKKYLDGQSIRKAFRAAQQEMAKKYAPFYWAGFILVE